MISPADLSNAYYRFKQTSISLAQSYVPFTTLSKPIPAVLSAIDADLPTYAAMYSNLSQPPSLLTDSTTSLSSQDSDTTSVDTLDEEDAMVKFYSQPPKKAHCRNRKNSGFEDVVIHDTFLDRNT